MKKRFPSLLLTLVLCVGLAVPAYAADSDFIIENGVLVEYAGGLESVPSPGAGLDIPDGVTRIGEDVFKGCEIRGVVMLPNSLTEIGDRAFAYSSFTSYDIRSSVTKIGAGAFSHSDVSDITIPGSVTALGSGAFEACHSLEYVRLGDGITELSDRLFYGCENMHSVDTPANITKIGKAAFYSCKKLSSITIPSSVTEIAEDAFEGCDKVIFMGEVGSYAERYAKEHNIAFFTEPVTPFDDVPNGSWYADAVNWALYKGVTNGTSWAGTFSPTRECTHAQILAFLYRANRDSFELATDKDMDKAVAWAREKGMIGADFDPKAPCTRADAVKYIWQALGSKAPKEAGSFTDVSADADYAQAAAWAVELGIAEGTGGGKFSPGKVCDRATIVTLLHRAYVPGVRVK